MYAIRSYYAFKMLDFPTFLLPKIPMCKRNDFGALIKSDFPNDESKHSCSFTQREMTR